MEPLVKEYKFTPVVLLLGLMNKKRLVNNAKKVTPAWVSSVSSVNIDKIEIIENETYKKSVFLI